MLSYQHIYHAGNPADVFKHLVLIEVLAHLGQTHKPFAWLDTHAGRGVYDLKSPEAQKTREYLPGIARLWKEHRDEPLFQAYFKIIGKYNLGQEITRYPGSPALIAAHLRGKDRLMLVEKHPQEFEHLKKSLNTRGVFLHKRDAMEALTALIPPPENKGGVLIDPSYEIKSEYETVPRTVLEAVKKWPQGIYLLWYPLLPARRHEQLEEIMQSAPGLEGRLSHSQLTHADPAKERGLYGCGLFLVNAPESLQQKISDIQKRLATIFSPNV